MGTVLTRSNCHLDSRRCGVVSARVNIYKTFNPRGLASPAHPPNGRNGRFQNFPQTHCPSSFQAVCQVSSVRLVSHHIHRPILPIASVEIQYSSIPAASSTEWVPLISGGRALLTSYQVPGPPIKLEVVRSSRGCPLFPPKLPVERRYRGKSLVRSSLISHLLLE